MKNNLKEMILSLANGDEAAASEALAAELKLRLEAYMTGGNIHQFAGSEVSNLVDTDEFKKVSDTDPAFAKKLEMAWKGDAVSYARTKGKKFESLFQLMIKKTSVEKASSLIKFDSEMTLVIGNLKTLHDLSFPPVKDTFTDTSVWKQEKLAKESFEDADEYNALMEELMCEGTDGICVGAKVQPKANKKGEPFEVVKIVSDDTVTVKDEFGNRKDMLIKDLELA